MLRPEHRVPHQQQSEENPGVVEASEAGEVKVVKAVEAVEVAEVARTAEVAEDADHPKAPVPVPPLEIAGIKPLNPLAPGVHPDAVKNAVEIEKEEIVMMTMTTTMMMMMTDPNVVVEVVRRNAVRAGHQDGHPLTLAATTAVAAGVVNPASIKTRTKQPVTPTYM